MRFWDRITGGAATVSVELDSPFYAPGDTILVRATVSAGAELEAKSALVRLWGEEHIQFEVPRYDENGDQIGEQDASATTQTVQAEQRIAGPIKLAQGEQYVIETRLAVPFNAPPSYAGPKATHIYKLSVALDVAWSTNPGATVDVVIGLRGPE